MDLNSNVEAQLDIATLRRVKRYEIEGKTLSYNQVHFSDTCHFSPKNIHIYEYL